MSENKRVTIPFLEKVLKPIVDLVKTKADKNNVYTKEDLAKVATSGSYSDLSDVPVPDVTLTVEGSAADAKATGDAIELALVKAEIMHYCPDIVFDSDVKILYKPGVTEITVEEYRGNTDYDVAYFPDVVMVSSYAFEQSSVRYAIFPKATMVQAGAFLQCENLQYAYFPSLVEAQRNSFGGTGIIHADFPALETLGEQYTGNVFAQCKSLVSINLPKLKEAYVDGGRHFRGDQKLTDVNLPELECAAGQMFDGCVALTKLDLPKAISIGRRAFQESGIETLILRSETVTTLVHTNAFTDTPFASGTGYIYVPAALIEDYKVATNWSTYAAQFRAIEDYPEICGEINLTVSMLDDTLSVEGAPADAKAVGEAIANLNTSVANIPQADWEQNDEMAADYIKNRTHYEIAPTVISTTTYGASATIGGSTFYKVSDIAPTQEELLGGKFINKSGTEYIITSELFAYSSSFALYISDPMFAATNPDILSLVIVYHDSVYSDSYVINGQVYSATFGTGTGKAGIYVLASSCKELQYGGVLSQLDEKYIPDTIARTEDLEGLATEEYVDTKVADLVNAAPETLDTLKELSAALGDDPNFATTVLTQLGNKADKDDIPAIDATLTVEGAAADAKAVGDALAETGVWYVHATANDDGSFTLDKTYDEIIAAYNAGRKVQCEMRYEANPDEGAYIFDLIAFGPYVPDVYDGDTIYNGALFVLWMQNRMIRMLITTDNQVMIFETNKFLTYGELQIRYGNELMYAGHMGVDVDIDLNIPINAPKDYVAFTDQVNGYIYYVSMRNGTLVSSCAVKIITIASMPDKVEYMAGEDFDSAGLTLMATRYDGTMFEVTDFTYNAPSPLTEDVTSIPVTYTDMSVAYTVDVPITVNPFDPEVILVDFEYTDNGDGTYTITGWKGTYNGEASTEMIIPDYSCIIV